MTRTALSQAFQDQAGMAVNMFSGLATSDLVLSALAKSQDGRIDEITSEEQLSPASAWLPVRCLLDSIPNEPEDGHDH